MSSDNNNKVVSKALPHTIKKFELIERYVKEWVYKLMNYDKCQKLVYIDCMSNSGEYYDESGKTILGTAVRVAECLHKASLQYHSKEIHIYLNDIDERKVEHLKDLLPKEEKNYKLHITCMDAGSLLKNIGPLLMNSKETHTLLVYDPYTASIDWDAVMPFFNTWGEVIINHMVSDSIRAVPVAKRPDTIRKYEQTYRTTFDKLLPFGTNKNAYEARIEEIISNMRAQNCRDFYIAAFPFFSRKNAVVYNLIHYTNSRAGFRLFKKSAWKTFDGKSSGKDTHGTENQLTFNLFGSGESKTVTDEDCYYIKDIADYVQSAFNGKKEVPLDIIWALLDEHPIFPYDGFRNEIKKELKQNYAAIEKKGLIDFQHRG